MFGQAPNSRGVFWDLVSAIDSSKMGTARGICYTEPSSVTGNIAAANAESIHTSGGSGDGHHDGIGIDLSMGSAIYNGSKMQPAALVLLPCIRV